MKIIVDDPGRSPVRELLEAHLAGMHEATPPESVHALDIDGLRAPEITFWTVWDGDDLLGCGALKELDDTHGEIKSMRTADEHLGKGVASRLMDNLLAVARDRGYTRLSLETGSGGPFEAALRFYEKHGFEYCGPFADYGPDPFSRFMTLRLQ
ncbi:MAG: GNAT family N-acetyltransferase [Woeseiaceae bacterium]|nr:GNAT family N-acetyltransferase [Woeseiaceae bacterium]